MAKKLKEARSGVAGKSKLGGMPQDKARTPGLIAIRPMTMRAFEHPKPGELSGKKGKRK